MTEQISYIPARLKNAAVNGHVAGAEDIIDDVLNRTQNDINEEVAGVPYNATTPNGMGKVVLKKNDNFKQVVEAQSGNTIFIIKYDFTLGVVETKTLTFTNSQLSSVVTPEYTKKVSADAAYAQDPTEENRIAKEKADAAYVAIGSIQYYAWQPVNLEAGHALHLYGRAFRLNDSKSGEVPTENGVIFAENDMTVYIGCIISSYNYRYDKYITIPSNCELDFEGGSINNGTIVGNNTIINAQPRMQIFSDVDIQGTWNVTDIYVEWMDIPTSSECAVLVRSILRLQNDNIQQNIYFPDYELAYTPIDDFHERKLIELSSNTHLHIINKIKVNRNNLTGYEVISAENKKNITIDGGGEIVGDVGNHDYVSGSTSEWGMGISLYNCHGAVIRNITISKCIGDGIYLGGSKDASEDDFTSQCTDISISEVHCLYNRRQGMSVIGINNLYVVNSEFAYTGTIERTNPSAGIDFEPNSATQTIANVTIDGCKFHRNQAASVVCLGTMKNINIVNCDLGTDIDADSDGYKPINNSDGGLALDTAIKNCHVSNCHIISVIYASKNSTYNPTDVMFDNCRIHALHHYSVTDNFAVVRPIFNNCIFTADDYKAATTIDSFIFVRCNAEAILNGCTVDYSTRKSGQAIIKGSATKLVFEYYNCNGIIHPEDSSIRRIIGCIVNSMRLNVIKGLNIEIVGNTITEYANIQFMSVYDKDVSKWSPTDDQNIHIKLCNNQFVGSNTTSSYLIDFYYTNKNYQGDMTIVGNTFKNKKILMSDLQRLNNGIVGSFAISLDCQTPVFDGNNKPYWWNGSAYVDASGNTPT